MEIIDTRQARIREQLVGLPEISESLLAPELVDAYASDWLAPLAVVLPDTAEKLAAVVGWANAEQVPIIPWGAGDQQTAGLPRPVEAVVLSLARLNRIVEVDAGNLTATVEAGANVADFQSELAKHDRVLPLDPANAASSTVGGMIATNASGPKRLAHGTARDCVLGQHVVLPTGELIHAGGKTVKNVAGYDMRKLFIGSWGTLGVITDVTMKLLPATQARRTLLGRFMNLEEAGRVVGRVLNSGAVPSSIELIDGVAGQLVGSSVGLTEGDSLLMMEVEGLRPVVTAQCDSLAGVMRDCGALGVQVMLEQDTGVLWDEYRRTPRHLEGEFPGGIWMKMSVPLASLFDALAAAKRQVAQRNLLLGYVAHAGNGVARLFVGGIADTELAQSVAEIRAIAGRYGGFLLVERAPFGLADALRVRPPRDDYPLMKALKERLDPNRIMNPGRVVAE